MTEIDKRKFQHKELAEGRWNTFSFEEQMANIGSEVERALNWRAKKNEDYANRAFERALELFDLTLDDTKHKHRLREITRAREAWVDFYANGNEYGTSEKSWRKYFLEFTFATRRNR